MLCFRRFLERFPTRYVVGVMMFLSVLIGYIVRSSLSLSLLAMVNVYDENGTLVEQPDYGPRFDWTAYQQGLLLGAFFYGYTLTTLPIGLLLDRFGIGRPYTIVAFTGSAAVLLLSPWAAASGQFAYLFAIRVCLGCLQGGLFPNLHRLTSKWAPPTEVGRFLFAAAGSSCGTVLTWVLAGAVIQRWGWRWSFYTDAAFAVAFVALYAYNVYDRPAQHPRIAAEEREFIERSKPTATMRDQSPSFRRMLCSRPFWVVLVMHCSDEFGFYFMLSGVPKFMHQVLGYQLQDTGLLAALPMIVNVAVCMVAGPLGDRLIKRRCVSLLCVRKMFVIFSHCVPGLCMLAMPFVPVDRPYLCIVLMTIGFGSGGTFTQSTLANVHDLGAACAATTTSIINCVAATNGFLSPLVVAYFTSERNTVNEWQYVFAIGAGIYLGAALIFWVLGSATDQKWSKEQTDEPLNVTSIDKVEEKLNDII